MKFYAITTALIAVLALIAGSLVYCCLRTGVAASRPEDALTWLRTEFQLSPQQLERIERLHADYVGVCAEHCALISLKQAEVVRLQEGNASAAAVEKAVAEAAAVDAHCIASVEAHVREVADLIGGAQGQRYLSLVLPKIARFDHSMPPDLRLSAPGQTDAQPACH